MFENLSLGHLLLVLIVFLLLFGAKRLPEMGQSLGQGIREFKKSFGEIQRDDDPSLVRRDEPAPVPRPRDVVEPERSEPKRLLE